MYKNNFIFIIKTGFYVYNYVYNYYNYVVNFEMIILLKLQYL